MKKQARIYASVFGLFLLFTLVSVGASSLKNALVLSTTSSAFSQMSERDAQHYANAWAAQHKADWKIANEHLSQVTDKSILGVVLAERYLHRRYDASKTELVQWLEKYQELPQAYQIQQLLASKSPLDARNFSAKKHPLLSVMGDDNGLATSFESSKYAATWQAAMVAYQMGDKATAASLFEKMIVGKDDLSPWKLSAAGYWAWKSYKALGNSEKAGKALAVAASEPRSFYGILARKQLRQPLDLNRDSLAITASELSSLMEEAALARSVFLVQTGRNDLAELELRVAFGKADRTKKKQLLKLAYELKLPAVQIAMARRLEKENAPLDLAKYPVPNWQPADGFRVDPALIFALIRQESGFRTSAVSPAGAMGPMQIMPSTASMIKERMKSRYIASASEVERNLSMGQYYIRHLLENPIVDDNIIYMLASYNAGIGRVQEWKQTLRYNNDPLLFIENIPYDETRYYVMQVMTNYWLYSELLGQETPALGALAMGSWPRYGEQQING